MSKYLKFAAAAVLVGSTFSAAAQQDDQAERLYDRAVQQDAAALMALQDLAKDKNIDALMALGFMYEHGVGVARDVKLAIANYALACHQGGQYGCANAAYFFEYGIGIDKDASIAERYIGLIAKDDFDNIDDVKEMERQRHIVYEGKAKAETDVEMRLPVIEYLERHVGSASSDARTMMARIGFTKQDTLRLARVWAEQDKEPGMLFQVGSFYNFGYSHVEKKDLEAFKWWQRAAEAGEPHSQNLLGLAYVEGKWGVDRDPAVAVSWFERAAAQSDRDGLVNLGEIYYLGEIVPVDYARARTLFEEAIEQGSARAPRFLSWIYYNGQSVKTDCKKALQYRQERRNHQADAQDDAKFLAQCKSDLDQRKQAGKAAPTLRLQHKSTYHGGNDGALACEPHFVVTTDKVSEIANLRITVELKNDQGATTQRTLAFSPFGMNTMNEGLDGRAWDSFSSSTLVPMKTKEFCEFQADYRITEAKALINGRNADLKVERVARK
ncbi:tetratricopeptide repeat protein [Achromobacter sp.]|uniref:SEL1-like repeat protein n=1 Tax=Achromobacter sp. TaxID=134375 RepID=UPI002897908F|nr:tetratricopeptide repeat protein [Achromobacter sp.]